MLTAIIEYELNPGVDEEFLGIIAGGQPEIQSIDGFISADPARSVQHEGMMYEISYWHDTAALSAWSDNELHGAAKRAGRERLLEWYRIRVGDVTRDWAVGAIPPAKPAAA